MLKQKKVREIFIRDLNDALASACRAASVDMMRLLRSYGKRSVFSRLILKHDFGKFDVGRSAVGWSGANARCIWRVGGCV